MQNYEYLLHLLYCAVHDLQPQEKPDEVSFLEVLSLGKAHEVGNFAFLSVERLQHKPAAEVYRDWQLFYFFSVQRDMRQRQVYEQVTSLLHSHGIRTLEAQGTVTKTLYPSPELRMMSDVDFIIDPDRLEPVKALLEAAGYNTWQHEPQELNVEVDGLLIEFHTDFFLAEIYARRERFAEAIHSPFAHAVPDENNVYKYILDDTYFYLYSVLHTIKHFEISGCGIRRVLDLYYLKKAYQDKIDTAYVQSTIAQYGFQNSYDTLFALEAYWFEGEAPSTDISGAIKEIITAGNHGNRDSFTKNSLAKDRRDGVRFARLSGVLAFLFPPREYIWAEYPQFKEKGYSAFRCRVLRVTDKLRRLRLKEALHYVRTMLRAK